MFRLDERGDQIDRDRMIQAISATVEGQA